MVMGSRNGSLRRLSSVLRVPISGSVSIVSLVFLTSRSGVILTTV